LYKTPYDVVPLRNITIKAGCIWEQKFEGFAHTLAPSVFGVFGAFFFDEFKIVIENPPISNQAVPYFAGVLYAGRRVRPLSGADVEPDLLPGVFGGRANAAENIPLCPPERRRHDDQLSKHQGCRKPMYRLARPPSEEPPSPVFSAFGQVRYSRSIMGFNSSTIRRPYLLANPPRPFRSRTCIRPGAFRPCCRSQRESAVQFPLDEFVEAPFFAEKRGVKEILAVVQVTNWIAPI
jgi:hypothetical protein